MALGRKNLDKQLYQKREREKELAAIKFTLQALNSKELLDQALQLIVNYLPQAWQYPEYTVAQIIFDDKEYLSNAFAFSQWKQEQFFNTVDGKSGSIAIFYTKEFRTIDEGPFMIEERDLINNLAFMIGSAANRRTTSRILYDHKERLKELQCINQTAEILRLSNSIEDALNKICAIIPPAWQYPEFTVARIKFGDFFFQSKNFYESSWFQSHPFETHGRKGLIEVYYLKEFPSDYEGPFMKEERHLINNLAGLISGSATKYDFEKLIHQNTERVKELDGINITSEIIMQGLSFDVTLQKICSVLSLSWQYPNDTVSRIVYGNKVFISSDSFNETPWKQSKNFVTIENIKGSIEIFYLKEFPIEFEGPFLHEERNLINNLAILVSGYINTNRARDVIGVLPYRSVEMHDRKRYSEVLERKRLPLPPLQEFFDKRAIDKYIYLDMMRYKVKEILFVATLYDAFILDNEDGFFEQFMGEIYQYTLFSIPRITGVSSPAEALELIQHTRFDLVIIMLGTDKAATFDLSQKIKKIYSDIPVYLLLNKIGAPDDHVKPVTTAEGIDKIFVWNGDAKVFFAIVKVTEDAVNLENDTNVGLVRVILLVEDSPDYYSRYLTQLYSIVFGQVQHLIASVKNELDKISKMRSRPKIVLATNYEEAVHIFNKYKDHILCVISDVEFEKEGVYSNQSGISFVKYVRSQISALPIALQSSDKLYMTRADEMKVTFINKNADNLFDELKRFVNYHLGFGHFVFRNKEGESIGVAHDLKDFIDLLATVPDESIEYHALRNQFSIWLMSRGEIKLAKMLNPVQVYYFETITEFRTYIIATIRRAITDKQKGKIIDFDDSDLEHERNIISLATGSMGGKGRGLAFINTLISNFDFSEYAPDINLCTPLTMIIGTDEFELFMKHNALYSMVFGDQDHNTLKQAFVKAELSSKLLERLRKILERKENPLAIRSSSLSEDSLTQPFSGVFDTYLLPNNHPDFNVRFEQLTTAIKLVYLSIYSKEARNYYATIHHKVEDEKMAVVIQDLVGKAYDNVFYPQISGVAQSYNFYPFAHMKPEEGFAVMAVGLGEYVVKGACSYRFSPKYPDIVLSSPEDQMKQSQVYFYAVDMARKDLDLIGEGEHAGLCRLDISNAKKHGTLNHCASTYDFENSRLLPGLDIDGPLVINFANILKYNYIPLAKTIDVILNAVKNALGSPVEIEFAVDIDKDDQGKASFYLLQIKPLVGNQLNFDIDVSTIDRDKLILYASASLGNGHVTDICDIIFVEPETFDKMQTLEMVNEIEEINHKMIIENRKYILIGPGRWGTRDRFLGIPVVWSQISYARAIVEMSLDDFPLEASLGSHFFHNVVSMNVGYLAVQKHSSNDFINWNLINAQQLISKTKYFKHIRCSMPLDIIMDGQKRIAAFAL